MSNVIIYSSSHGTTAKVSSMIKDQLKGDTDLINLKKKRNPDISSYEKVIIGGSIHMGRFSRKVKKFVERKKDELLGKKFGLFICCMDEGEGAQKEFEISYPLSLKEKAQAKGILGGEFLFDKMSAFQRFVVKKVAGITETTKKIDEKAIKKFASEMNKT